MRVRQSSKSNLTSNVLIFCRSLQLRVRSPTTSRLVSTPSIRSLDLFVRLYPSYLSFFVLSSPSISPLILFSSSASPTFSIFPLHRSSSRRVACLENRRSPSPGFLSLIRHFSLTHHCVDIIRPIASSPPSARHLHST